MTTEEIVDRVKKGYHHFIEDGNQLEKFRDALERTNHPPTLGFDETFEGDEVVNRGWLIYDKGVFFLSKMKGKDINFRMVDLPKTQVLLMKDFGPEEDEYSIDIVFFLEGVKIKQTIGLHNEQDRNLLFETMPDDSVQKLVDDALNMVS